MLGVFLKDLWPLSGRLMTSLRRIPHVFVLIGDYPREDASYGDSYVNYCNRGNLAIQNAQKLM